MPRGAIQVGVSIGAGSAYANDRLAPAAAMADSGRVTYIGFDSLAERTMALQATLHDGVLTISSDRGSVSLEPQRWK